MERDRKLQDSTSSFDSASCASRSDIHRFRTFFGFVYFVKSCFLDIPFKTAFTCSSDNPGFSSRFPFMPSTPIQKHFLRGAVRFLSSFYLPPKMPKRQNRYILICFQTGNRHLIACFSINNIIFICRYFTQIPGYFDTFQIVKIPVFQGVIHVYPLPICQGNTSRRQVRAILKAFQDISFLAFFGIDAQVRVLPFQTFCRFRHR